MQKVKTVADYNSCFKLKHAAKTMLISGIVVATAGRLFAQTAPSLPTTNDPSETDDANMVVLSPFVVDASKDRGYQATSTLAGTRIRTDLADVGSSISVITPEMLQDLGATNNESVLAYAVNTEVGGPRGNFSGGVRSGTYQEQDLFRNPNANTRVRGLTAADNTRNYFLTDVPWDGYTVSRVDLLRGPNAILFGLGSPAGVVNATTNDAIFQNKGSAEATFDKYGSQRYVLDYNQQLLPGELAIRVTALKNEQKFQEKPAFSNDDRIYAAIKYAPKFLNRNGVRFEISGNYENGNINSNRPRIVTPSDQFSGFWQPESEGGVNKQTYNFVTQGLIASGSPGFSNSITAGIPGNILQILNSNNGNTWERTTIDAYRALRADGSSIPDIADKVSGENGIFPRGNTGEGNRLVINSFNQYASQANLPFGSFGAYNANTITDPSVFDYYHKLLDGDNKREWNDWNVFNLDVTNTFFNDQLGYDISYFRQHLKNGQWSAMGWNNTIYMDINDNNLDGTVNKDVGRAYVQVEDRNGGNGQTSNNREAKRVQLFGEYNFAKHHEGLWARALGLHRLTGVVSQEDLHSDSRTFRYSELDPASLALFTPATKIEGDPNGDTLSTGFRYYLSGDLRGQSSAAGSNLSNFTTSFLANEGGPISIHRFDNTWIAGAGVSPGAVWINPVNPTGTYTQSNNPANYRGWVDTPANLVTIHSSGLVDGESAQDYLTTDGTVNDFDVNSKVLVWQGYFWDKAIVGTYGYRKDRARNYLYISADRNGTGRADNGEADLSPATYNFDNPAGNVEYVSTITKNWSIVSHLNQFLGKHDFLPINISLSYNQGENFQPLAGRIDAFAQPLAPPSGKTKERSILLSTKDNKYTVRLTKYETEVLNGNSTSSIGAMYGLEGTLADGANYARQYRSGQASYSDYTAAGGDATKLQNQIIPAWFQFEKDLEAKYPAFVNAWINKTGTSDWGGAGNNVVQAGAPAGFAFTEDSQSKGYEIELTANPTSNWRIELNGSKTSAVRENVPGVAFKDVAAYISNEIENTDVGLIPGWWAQNTFGIRNVGYWTLFRPDYLKNNALNGQSASEVRQWHGNLITNYTFTNGAIKGLGVGAGYRYESKAVIGYAPMLTAAGFTDINLKAPFYAPADRNLDLWVSYERKITKAINWKIQLNVFNVGGKNELVPFAASVDADKLAGVTVTPTTVIPMKASAFTIREGMSWQISNTFEF